MTHSFDLHRKFSISSVDKMVLGVARTKHQADIASLCCKENQRHFSIRQLRRVSFPIIGFLIVLNECDENLVLCFAIAVSLSGLSKLLHRDGGSTLSFLFDLWPSSIVSHSKQVLYVTYTNLIVTSVQKLNYLWYVLFWISFLTMYPPDLYLG